MNINQRWDFRLVRLNLGYRWSEARDSDIAQDSKEYVRMEHEKLQNDAQKRMQEELEEAKRHEAAVAQTTEIAKRDAEHRAEVHSSGAIWGVPDPGVVVRPRLVVRKSPTKEKEHSRSQFSEPVATTDAAADSTSPDAADEVAVGGKSVRSLVSKFGMTSLRKTNVESPDRPTIRRPTLAQDNKQLQQGFIERLALPSHDEADEEPIEMLEPGDNILTLNEVRERLKTKVFDQYNPAKIEVRRTSSNMLHQQSVCSHFIATCT